MPRYTAQFISSSIVAFSASERGIVQHWIDCNNYAPDVNPIDPDTGEIIPDQWVKGECLGLFKLVRSDSEKTKRSAKRSK